MYDKNRITYIGMTDFRNQKTKFGIKALDRTKHVYIIGKTGMGKSVLLENMAVQDIQNGDGLAFMDPHGSAIEKLLEYVPPHRIDDIVYFAPFDTDYPISFNVMEDIGPDKRHLVVGGLMSSFKKIWQDAWSARMEYILTNTLLALLEYPDSTLLGVNRMLADKSFRDKIIANVKDAAVKAFWVDEFNKWDPKFAREATAAIQNKIGQFTANPLIRNIIGQPKSSFDLRELMDNHKIILINLSKGLIGEQNANLLGGMIITKIYLAAMSRADVGAERLERAPNFYFFVDEFQNFANETFADILAEARKYHLNLTVANQYIAQMEEPVRDAVFGNVGTTICFRVGPLDAEFMEQVFSPTFTKEDLQNTSFTQIYLTLSIDGIGSHPFSARTLPPIPKPEKSSKDNVIETSRRLYARPRTEVEKNITEWFGPAASSPSPSRDTGDAPRKNFTKPSLEEDRSAPPISESRPPEGEKEKEREVKKEILEEPEEMPEFLSSELKNLIDTIEAPVKEKKEEPAPAPIVPRVTPSATPAPMPSRTFVPKVPDRVAASGAKDALKSALAKALGDRVPEEKKEVAPRAPSSYLPETSSISEEPVAPLSPPPSALVKNISMTPKEIPEDILRKILE